MHHELCIFLEMLSRNEFFVLKNAQEDSMADTDDLEKELHNIWNSIKGVQVTITGASDTALVKGTAGGDVFLFQFTAVRGNLREVGVSS